ncbi:hypothetical protein BRC72_13200 [Halobacteriales archaeon QH_7_66_36]|jgi:hypothetical protein|nr:MAG: hypothetical protein BRC72_13200 [Halobacteriales archaeon QH_7_66_36]
MAGYYDVVLGLIPVALCGLTAGLFVAGVSFSLAVVLASLVAVGCIGHAMFVRTPTGTSETQAPTAGPASAD